MPDDLMQELRPPVLTPNEAQMARSAERCIMAALDHSRAPAIRLVDEEGQPEAPVIELPPEVLRVVARVLGAMSEGRPVMLVPPRHEMTTMEAASFLGVSRPFVIKEIDAGRLECRMVGTHRRIPYEVLVAYRQGMRQRHSEALQQLADSSQDLGLGY